MASGEFSIVVSCAHLQLLKSLMLPRKAMRVSPCVMAEFKGRFSMVEMSSSLGHMLPAMKILSSPFSEIGNLACR